MRAWFTEAFYAFIVFSISDVRFCLFCSFGEHFFTSLGVSPLRSLLRYLRCFIYSPSQAVSISFSLPSFCWPLVSHNLCQSSSLRLFLEENPDF